MIVPKSSKKENITRKEQINAEDVYNEAIYYFDATIVLEKYRDKNKLCPPVIMNAMFSCELFSKSIIYSYDSISKEKKHTLYDLYKKFPDKIKTDIKDKFQNEIRFEQFLQEINDLFVIWRYRYEYQNMDTHYSFILEYMNILKNITDNLFAQY